MRSFASLLAIFAIIGAAVSPTFGQRSRFGEPVFKRAQKPSKIPASPKLATRFDRVESFSEGRGAYVRWQMAHERSNAGFIVYRMGRFGGRAVSEIVPGAAFKYGDRPADNEVYKYFDPDGTIGSIYFIEAINTGGQRISSEAAGTSYTNSVESLDGGNELKSAEFRLAAEPAKLSKDLDVYAELRNEIKASQAVADIDKHREVISQPGVRIAARKDGIIRVTRNQLESAGFDVNSDPANWQLYLEGVERPMLIGPNADHVEFFGKLLDTVESDTRMYYLINGSSPGKRVRSAVLRPGSTMFAGSRYKQSFSLKERTVYDQSLLNGDPENIFGRVFVGNNVNIPFTLSGIDRTDGTRTLRVTVRGFTSPAQHTVFVTLNGTSLGNVSFSNRSSQTAEFQVPVSQLIDGGNTLTLRSGGTVAQFDKMSIDFPRKYVAQGGRLDFYTDNYRRATVSGFASTDVRLFDVTNETDIKLMSNVEFAQTNGTWGPIIPALRGRVYSAIAASNFSGPEAVTANNPEVIRDPTQAGTLLIITHKDYLTQAQDWANYRTGQGTLSKLLVVDEIFDEFGFGVASSASIRTFLQYAKDNWSTPPSYVLLIGDASIDPKNLLGSGSWNQVPTELVDTLFEETGSDESLADFNNDGLAEIPIGRIPTRSTAGVSVALQKTIEWESAIRPNVLDRGALFAYDYFDSYDFRAISNRIMANLPNDMPKVTVQSDDVGANATLMNAFNEVDASVPLNSGVYVANYSGHGNAGAWRDNRLFTRTHIPFLTNAGRPTLITALTCLNGYFVTFDPIDSFAEGLLKAPNGGAVAMWASTGSTTADVQEVMAKRFYLRIGDGTVPRLGDIINESKAQLIAGADVRRSWALFGDPMLKVR